MKVVWVFFTSQVLQSVVIITSIINNKTHSIKDFELNISNKTKRSLVLKDTERLWKDGMIPYEFTEPYTGSQRRLILQAMKHWEEFTCIKFVRRNRQVHDSYIIFIKLNCGCCSVIGKGHNGESPISIDDDCSRFGTILHELGHVIGFFHEHLRLDRDDHIKINFPNIQTDQLFNFEKPDPQDVDTLDQPYDYGSITHYPALSSAKSSKTPVIVPRRKINGKLPEIGQRIKLSDGDILAANILYNCSKCGKTFLTQKAIFSPVTEQNYSITSFDYCEWTIKVSQGQKIHLQIKPLSTNRTSGKIYNYLEITNGYLSTSPIYALYHINKESFLVGDNYLILKYFKVSNNSSPIEFQVEYEAVCENSIFIESNDTYYLESPNYPETYEANKTCHWHISVPDYHGVSITFDYFEVGNSKGKKCIDDFLEIRTNNSRNEYSIGVYCGKLDPSVKIYSGMEKVHFIFKSMENNKNKAFGFLASITATPKNSKFFE